MKSSKGFTLIELLVVISIIALLSSVVLSALNSARAKAADSAVKASLKQLATQVQNYLDTQSNLGVSVTSCAASNPTPHVFKSDVKIVSILANIAVNDGAGTVTCTTDATGQKWAVSISVLKGGGSWCMDNSQGWFKAGAAQVTGLCN
ncbi:MAG: type II secretion system protein [Candidatus Paceibacterota bacterium]|jgi:prepilin-type N-terminal cleavage/methylation domain-containing protein